MEKAKVYYTDFRTQANVSQGEKLQKLCRKAGLNTVDFSGKFVAIKLHFGELGNFAYIRPNYVKAVADLVKELGGKPFLTDCNTLYPGSRNMKGNHAEKAPAICRSLFQHPNTIIPKACKIAFWVAVKA